jgi:hypothetical protein
MNRVTIQYEGPEQNGRMHVTVNGQPVVMGDGDEATVKVTAPEFGSRVTLSFLADVVKLDATDSALAPMFTRDRESGSWEKWEGDVRRTAEQQLAHTPVRSESSG